MVLGGLLLQTFLYIFVKIFEMKVRCKPFFCEIRLYLCYIFTQLALHATIS